jgi:hypothetical protein
MGLHRTRRTETTLLQAGETRMKTITFRVEDVDQVVIDELKDAYHRNNQFDKVDLSNDILEPDYELLKAIQTVLAYYMDPIEYDNWLEMNPMVKENV